MRESHRFSKRSLTICWLLSGLVLPALSCDSMAPVGDSYSHSTADLNAPVTLGKELKTREALQAAREQLEAARKKRPVSIPAPQPVAPKPATPVAPTTPSVQTTIPSQPKAPGVPTESDGFDPRKGWDGYSTVKNPNGSGRGYPDNRGSVWMPTGLGPLAHGGPHWDVQIPRGGYMNIYPGVTVS